jgi:hypothetical protein
MFGKKGDGLVMVGLECSKSSSYHSVALELSARSHGRLSYGSGSLHLKVPDLRALQPILPVRMGHRFAIPCHTSASVYIIETPADGSFDICGRQGCCPLCGFGHRFGNRHQ